MHAMRRQLDPNRRTAERAPSDPRRRARTSSGRGSSNNDADIPRAHGDRRLRPIAGVRSVQPEGRETAGSSGLRKCRVSVSRVGLAASCFWARARARRRRPWWRPAPRSGRAVGGATGGGSRRPGPGRRRSCAESRAHETTAESSGVRRQSPPRGPGHPAPRQRPPYAELGDSASPAGAPPTMPIHGGARGPRCGSKRSERARRIAFVAGRR